MAIACRAGSGIRQSALVGALIALASGQPAAASRQDAPAKASEPDEIVITARRREEALERAAAAVSAVSGDKLVERGARLAQDLNAIFPALTVQPTASGNLIFIRGVGNFTLLPNSDPAVGFVLDGVFISRPMGTMSQYFDVDRVELLKGPQGVLYGRNASAGSINIEPRQPVVGETSARANASFATYDRTAEAAANLALGKSAALRISAAVGSDAPYLTGPDTHDRQLSGRAQVKALLGSRVTVRLSGDYNHAGGASIGSSYVGNYVYDPATRTYRFIESALPLSEGLYSERSQAFRQTIFLNSAGRNLDAIGSKPSQDSDYYGAHMRVDADLGFAGLTVIPAWRRASIDSILSSAPFGYRLIEQDEQISLEARLAGRSGDVDWLVGAFLFDDTIDNSSVTNLSSAIGQSNQRYDTLSEALFANGTLHVSPSLRVSGGLRHTRDRKTYRSRGETLSIICTRRAENRNSCPAAPLFPLVEDFGELPFAVPELPGTRVPLLVDGVPTGALVARNESRNDGNLVDRALTWRFGADADVAAGTLAYANAETGYRPGGFSSGVGFESYEPERIRAYTLGLRHRGLGERLQLDLEAFWWNYRDQQVSSLRPDLSSPPRNVNITDNIGNSRIRGIELELGYVPWRGSRVGATVQYLDADYRSFEYVQANTGVAPLTGCAATLNAATNLYLVDCKDKQPYNSPKWALALNGRHSFDLGSATLTAAVDSSFRSTRNVGFAFLPEQRIGPTWMTNAQLIYRPSRGPLEIAAFVRNIGARRTEQFMIFHPVSNALIAITNPPRQWGLRAQWKF